MELITADMSPDDIQQSVSAAVQLQIKRTQQKAQRLIEKAQQVQKQKELLQQTNTMDEDGNTVEITSTDKVRGTQKSNEGNGNSLPPSDEIT